MRFTRYIVVLISFVVVISGCADENVQLIDNTSVDGNAVTICGRITAFDDRLVDTRAGKTLEESYSSSMAMAIFPILVDESSNKYLGDCISYIHIQGSNVNFTIDRSKLRETYGTTYDNTDFALYLFANMPELPATMDELDEEGDKSLNFFMTKAYANSNGSIRRPLKGFPMVGSLGDYVTEGADGNKFVLIPTDDGEGETTKIKLPSLNDAPSDYIPIPLKALYAKFSFAINVKPDQHIQNGVAPEFTLESYTVNNVPSRVYAKTANNTDHTNVSGSAITTSVGTTITEGSTIEFDFYLPERCLTPNTLANEYDYPLGENGTLVKESGVREEDKSYLQRFKPKLVDDEQKATYVTLNGYYKDHQNHDWNVTYDIYLGEDNYSDFNYYRNKNYVNNVVIRGLTASKDQSSNATGFFIDHRVNVNRSLPIIINLQRETLLDSHFEVRPLRIRYPLSENQSLPSGAKVKVEILNADGTTNNIPSWIRMEHNNGTGSVTTHLASGKRKYFTTDLVTTTLASNTSLERNITVKNQNETFWIYVDQCDDGAPLSNPNKMREAMIRVTYEDTDPNTESHEPMTYKICQHLLYPVKTTRAAADVSGTSVVAGEYIYYIEYEEEYLHNFDSEDSYSNTDEAGMKWGLDNIQLSYKDKAISIISTASGWEQLLEWLGWNKQEIVNNAINKLDPIPYYDFYMVRDVISTTPITPHAFNGLNFNKNIVSYLKSQKSNHQTEGNNEEKFAKIEKIALDETPNSAIAYCYNRNKRNSEGNVVSHDWYLPAIDEIEDIMENAYGDFDTEFQGNMYWSCQPAYFKYNVAWSINTWAGSGNTTGIYFLDNTNRVRATKALRENNSFVGVPNSGDMIYANQDIAINKKFLQDPTITPSSPVLNESYDQTYENYDGNMSRGDKARVRCVRKSEGVTVANDN